MQKYRVLKLGSSLLATALVTSSVRLATADAISDYASGAESYRRGDYTSALAKFTQAATTAAPSLRPKVYLSIETVELVLGHPLQAHHALKKAEADLNLLPEAERATVEKERERLDRALGQLVITSGTADASGLTDKPGARIRIDDRDAEPGSLASPVYVVPGTHLVVAFFDSVPSAQIVRVEAGQRVNVRLDPVPQIGWLALRCAEASARVDAEDIPVGGEPHSVRAGRHRVSFSGASPALQWPEMEVEVAANSTVVVQCGEPRRTLALRPQPAAPGAQPPARGLFERAPFGFVAIGGGLVVASAALLVNFKAEQKREAWNQQNATLKSGYSATLAQRANGLKDDYERDKWIAGGLAITSGVLVAGGAALLIANRESETRAAAPRARTQRSDLTVACSPSAVLLDWRGTW